MKKFGLVSSYYAQSQYLILWFFFPLLFVLFKCSGACIAFWIDVLVNMLHGYGDKSPFRHSSSIGFLEGKEEKIFLRCQ